MGSPQRHKLSVRGDDLYESPPVAVDSLVKHVELPKGVWEPACGPGVIARTLRDYGHHVVATDLIDYESADQDGARRDFLLETKAPPGVDAIVTNPPYKTASEFALHAIQLVPRVYFLLRLSFLEAGNGTGYAARARREALDGGKLHRVLVFRRRLPAMHRHGWTGKRASPGVAYAWFEWRSDRDPSEPATLSRITWGEK